MIISDLEFYLVEIPCEEAAPVRTVLVRLGTDTGLEGWGEAQLDWRASELEARRDTLLPVLMGRSVFDIEDLLGLEVLRPAALRCALEIASWDLVGRIARQPLCHLFGGGYRQRVPLAVRLEGSSPDQVAQLAGELAEQGFHWQIVGSSGQVAQDLAILAAVREKAGERAELSLDAAVRYEMDVARELCTELEDADVQFVLDPLAGGALDQVASLRRQTSVSLAVRRSIQRPADMLLLLRHGAADTAIVDMELVGGLVPARKCGAIAQAGEIQSALSSGRSLGISVAAMVQLAAAAPAFSNRNECTYHQLQDDVLVDRLEIADGMISVPRGPGLGIEVDRAKVERYQVT
jgi:L-alanine-DL-glutamate epimerase-like enolase superfamily enzyme